MRKYIISALIVILLINSCICVYAENITELQEQSSEITQDLVETNNRLQAVQDEMSDNMAQLQELDNKIVQSEEEINNIHIEVEELNTQIIVNEEKLQKTQKEYDDIQGLLDARLIQMYETPELGFLQVLFESKNISELLSSYYAMKELAEYDKELLETVKKQKQEIETTKIILGEKKTQVVKSKQIQQRKKQVLTNAKTAEEQQLQAQIDEYNAQVATIEAEIKLLSLNTISEDYIGGAMIWPVPGYTRITSHFGMRVHPITGAYKLHTGTDVSAPIGASFVAAANGIVVKATYNTSYGNMVIIDHGGGVQTLYAHGSEIVVQIGQTVATGDEILKVGSTGYSTGPHAHFEIRINGQTVDPEKFLVQNEANKENNS